MYNKIYFILLIHSFPGLKTQDIALLTWHQSSREPLLIEPGMCTRDLTLHPVSGVNESFALHSWVSMDVPYISGTLHRMGIILRGKGQQKHK